MGRVFLDRLDPEGPVEWGVSSWICWTLKGLWNGACLGTSSWVGWSYGPEEWGVSRDFFLIRLGPVGVFANTGPVLVLGPVWCA